MAIGSITSLTLSYARGNPSKRSLNTLDSMSCLCSLIYYVIMMNDVYKYRVTTSGDVLVWFWYRWVIIGIANTISIADYMFTMRKSFYKVLEIVAFSVGSYACYSIQYFIADSGVWIYMLTIGTFAFAITVISFIIASHGASNRQKEGGKNSSVNEYSHDGVASISDTTYIKAVFMYFVLVIGQFVMALIGPAGLAVLGAYEEQCALLGIDAFYKLMYILDVNSVSPSERGKTY